MPLPALFCGYLLVVSLRGTHYPVRLAGLSDSEEPSHRLEINHAGVFTP